MPLPPFEAADPVATPSAGMPATMLIFLIDGREYALPIDAVVEVAGYRPPTAVPGARPGILGILPLRGKMVTVIDGRSCLGLPGAGTGGEARLIVLRDGNEWVGLRVDGVRRVGAASAAGQRGAAPFDPSLILGDTR